MANSGAEAKKEETTEGESSTKEAEKSEEEKKAEWRANGHGAYEEIPEEKEFFNVTRKSDNCVIQVSSDRVNQ